MVHKTVLTLLTLALVTLTSAQKLSSRRISTSVKDDILNADSFADAYNKYMEAYTDPEDMLLMASTDPVSLKNQRDLQKKIFTTTLKKCRSHNELFKNGKSSYQMTVNSFSAMDSKTRKSFLGVSQNLTLLESGQYYQPAALKSSGSLQALPNSFDWKAKGYVTAVKNQGGCGSCWSYGAVGPIEWAYKKATGKLLSFSEQELLDCTYEHSGSEEDGCNGCWYTTAWDFVIANNHLPSEANYPYRGKDYSCSYQSRKNDLAGKIRVTGYTQSAKTEAAVLSDLVNKMPLAVAFTVEDDFYSIGDGIYDGCRETTYPNHAVVLTGYSSNYFEIKNSWGADWGLDGYARFERGRDICGLLSYAYYIEYKDLDDSDNGSDENKEDEKEDENEEDNEDNKDDDNEDEEEATEWDEEATEDNKEVKECREPDDVMGLKYRGTKSTTKSGLTCQIWDSQSPNAHTRISDNYPGTGLKNNNYCRNPDHFEEGLWCYNSESTEPRWEICDVPVCGEEEEEEEEEEATDEEDTEESTEWSTEETEDCLSEDDPQGINYRGTISITASGKKCVDWSQQRYTYNRGSYRSYMDKGLEENYCRRPDQNSARPWCYISRGRSPKWEYCDIPKCEKKDEGSSCKDEHESCVNWAHFKYCNDPAYEEFMSRTCRKSCNTCEEAGGCSDTGEDCQFWAQQGFCNTGLHGDYMDIHCKKSCGRCDGSNVDYQTEAYTEWWDRKTEATEGPTEGREEEEEAQTDWWDRKDNDPTEKQESVTEETKTEEPKQKTEPPCGGGLSRCPDGSCKHVHMCKKDY